MRSKELSSRLSFVKTQTKSFRAVDGYLGNVFELFSFKPSAKKSMTALALLIESYDHTTQLSAREPRQNLTPTNPYTLDRNLKVHVVETIDDAGKVYYKIH